MFLRHLTERVHCHCHDSIEKLRTFEADIVSGATVVWLYTLQPINPLITIYNVSWYKILYSVRCFEWGGLVFGAIIMDHKDILLTTISWHTLV